jgi:phosphoglycolate phosphatase
MNTATRLGRRWDRFDAYLFDIDGTLLNCSDATHYFAFCHALRMITGRELTLEGVTAHGNTDIGILRDALALAGGSDHEWRPRLAEIRDAMCGYVEGRRHEVCAAALPQVREVLTRLRANGALLGVATGNLERIGRIKLHQAGLCDLFDFGAFSDITEFRVDTFRNGIAAVREKRGESATVCIVGDTPADVQAAHNNDVPVIAVATGIHSYEQLAETRPELCLHSLGEMLSDR